MPLIDKSKPSITKWLEKNEHSICSYTQAGVREITMRNKGRRKREKEINLKVNIQSNGKVMLNIFLLFV